MMKRIVIDARESGTTTGRYIDKLIEYLHMLKPAHEIVVVTKPDRMEFLRSVAPNFRCAETTYKEFSFGEQMGFKSQLKNLTPDLVHFTMVQQPVFYKGRVVTSMLDLTTLHFKNPSKNKIIYRFKQWVYKYVNLRVAKKSDAIICISNYVKKDVIDFAHIPTDKITVTYNAADKITEPTTPISSLNGKRFIMYVGRPLPHKNLSRLIDAFAILQESFPDLYLVLAGKTDALFEAHKRNVEKQGIKNVIFTGFVSEGELRWLYEHTACYVFPSLSEGFGLPGLEAMVHGAPVASSNATCLPEIYEDAAVYFDPLSSRGMAGVIGKVLSDNELSKDLRAKGLKQASKYSWKRMAQQTLEVYDRVLSEKS